MLINCSWNSPCLEIGKPCWWHTNLHGQVNAYKLCLRALRIVKPKLSANHWKYEKAPKYLLQLKFVARVWIIWFVTFIHLLHKWCKCHIYQYDKRQLDSHVSYCTCKSTRQILLNCKYTASTCPIVFILPCSLRYSLFFAWKGHSAFFPIYQCQLSILLWKMIYFLI